MATYIIKKDTQNNYYWILKSDKNQKVVAKSSESYENRAGLMHSIQWTKVNAADADVRDDS